MSIVGIRNIGIYMPPKIKDSAKISELSGIPEEIIKEKFGILHVHEANDEETVSYMGIEASKRALNG
ncbi:MAG TPA: hypothetical protein PLD67_06610, partial [Sedimentibacter sp.]|nr:hypothetical protein [Sedimentibacter sp.]